MQNKVLQAECDIYFCQPKSVFPCSYLGGNQLKILPPDAFSNGTKLQIL